MLIYVASNNGAYLGVYIKYPIFLSDCNKICTFLTGFLKSLQYQILWKSIHWELRWYLQTDEQRQKDMAKLIGAFATCELPKNRGLHTWWICTCKTEIWYICFILSWLSIQDTTRAILHLACYQWVELQRAASWLTCYFPTNSEPKRNKMVSSHFCCCKLTKRSVCSVQLHTMCDKKLFYFVHRHVRKLFICMPCRHTRK
jgi:hypothetical protein